MRTDKPQGMTKDNDGLERFILKGGKKEDNPASIFPEPEERIEKLEKRVAELTKEIEKLKKRRPN